MEILTQSAGIFPLELKGTSLLFLDASPERQSERNTYNDLFTFRIVRYFLYGSAFSICSATLIFHLIQESRDHFIFPRKSFTAETFTILFILSVKK